MTKIQNVEIVHIEDEQTWVQHISDIIKRLGPGIEFVCRTPIEGYQSLKNSFNPKIIILDLHFNDDEIVVRKKITSMIPDFISRCFEIYIVSSFSDKLTQAEYTSYGVRQDHIFHKDNFDFEIFHSTLAASVEKIRSYHYQGLFSILHLSDLHFGCEKLNEPEQKNILNELTSDIEILSIKYQKPKLIVISGDIAFHGYHEEYIAAEAWLRVLLKKIPIPVFVVPGNHDSNFSYRTANLDRLYKALKPNLPEGEVRRIQREIIFQENVTKEITKKFDDFHKFCEKNGFISSRDLEFPLAYQLKGFSCPGLEMIGINTAMLAKKKGFKNELLTSGSQYNLLRNRNTKIVVMHHPFHWFINDEEVKNCLESRASLILMGHEHSPKLSQESFPESQKIFAGSLQPSDEPLLSYRYNWLSLFRIEQNSHKILNIILAPRIWNSVGREFRPDYNFMNSNKNDYIILKIPVN